MENKLNKFGLYILLILLLAVPASAKTIQAADSTSSTPDSLNILAQYSLFSEYFKNKDYQSALPFGWKVLKMNPEKFSKWIFYKMEDALWYLHDSTNASPEKIKAIQDTTLYLYNQAIKYNQGAKGYFEARRAFISETWLNLSPDTVIKEYEQAIKDDSTVSYYYFNRLGELYKNNASDNNNYKQKAIDLYSYLSDKQPDNQQWPDELDGLVENVKELAAIDKKAWDLDKNNLAKAWKYAIVSIKAQLYDQAISTLEFLVQKSPQNINYWTQLASIYQKIDKYDKAIDAYKTIIKLQPDNKDAHLNLGIAYKDKGDYPAARAEYLKANDVAKGGYGLAILYEGLLYETAARNCDFNFETKLVYQLAVDTYKKALNIDPSLVQAKERIPALASSVATKEDYFFRGYKSGQTVPITGKCYGWIDRSITVPQK